MPGPVSASNAAPCAESNAGADIAGTLTETLGDLPTNITLEIDASSTADVPDMPDISDVPDISAGL